MPDKGIIDKFFGFLGPETPTLDRPIFLVGCPKSGTTLLGLIFQYHPKIGPSNPHVSEYSNIQSFLDSIAHDDIFNSISVEMEERALWDEFFPVNNVDLRAGKQLILWNNPLSARRQSRLIQRLTKPFHEERFFSKQPVNTFRIHVLREMFPDAKLVAIHRNGSDVISSWGRKVNRWEVFGGYEQAIKVFARKWNEAIDHIEDHKEELAIHTVFYEDLIQKPQDTLRTAFDFCELEYIPEIFDQVRPQSMSGKWRERIPEEYHELVLEETKRNRERLGYSS